MSDSEQIYWNQLLEPPIKPHVNNSSKWRWWAEAEQVSTPGRPVGRPAIDSELMPGLCPSPLRFHCLRLSVSQQVQ